MRVKILRQFCLFTLLALTLAQDSYAQAVSNGIVVEKPKPFDFRELDAMLKAREDDLKTLRGIDSAKLSSAVGAVQGARAETTSFAISATEAVNPATDAPSVPPTPAQTTLIAPAPSFGINARDILAEQVS